MPQPVKPRYVAFLMRPGNDKPFFAMCLSPDNSTEIALFDRVMHAILDKYPDTIVGGDKVTP
jgi:hypothetical protein